MQRNFKKLAKFAVLCGLAVGIMVHPAFATDAPVRTTEKVVVTAGRIAEKAKTVTQNVTVIDEEMIQKNQHKSLEEVLRQNGVQILRAGAVDTTMTPQVVLRGMRTSGDDPNQGQVMVLVDGRRTASTNIAMIPMVSIARVEVLRGPAAIQYGSTAMGGVVNVITKRGTEQTQASLEIGGGSWETWKGMAGVSGMVGDMDYALGFSHSLRNGNWKDGDGNKIHNSEYGGMTTYSANVGYTFLDEHRIGVSFIGANFDRLGDPGPTYTYKGYSNGAYVYDPAPHGSTPNAWSDRKNYALDVNYTGGIKDYGLGWMLRYSNSEEDYIYADTGYSSTNESKNQGSQAQLTWKYKFLTLTGGVDWMNSEYQTSGYSGQVEQNNIGTFLLAKTAFLDEKLVFSFGSRYDDFSLKFQELDTNDDNVSFSAGVAYNPLDWLSLRANVGESFRMPTGLEIAGYDGGWSSYIGNKDLKPEEGLGWDVGFEVEKKGFRAGLTYFSTDYDDKIIATYTPASGNNKQFINLDGTTKYRGLEGNVSYDLGQTFDWDFMVRPYVNFTHMLQYEDHEGKDVPYVRDWMMGFGVNYSHPSIGLDVDLCFTYLGDYLEDNFYQTATTSSKYITTGGDVTADLTIVKTLYETDDMGKFSAKLDLRNLFDKQYALKDGYPMPGRSFFLSLIWNY